MMTSEYNTKSCNALEKPFYRPVEAAIRWCGLIARETEILAALSSSDMIPKAGQFPLWPCLQTNTEKILDAILNDDMPHGRDGCTVAANDHVARARLTVRHTDLREWMAKNYPDQKPAFLFDEIERGTHTAITADTYRVLKAAHDAKEQKLSQAIERIREAEEARSRAETERDSMRAMVDNLTAKQQSASAPGERSETTYLNIIGGLLGLMLGKSPAGTAQSTFANQSAIISTLLAHYDGKPGISARTLEEKFASSKRSLTAT